MTRKPGQELQQLLPCHLPVISVGDGAGAVLGIGFIAQGKPGKIAFLLVGEDVTGTGCSAHKHRQHPGCHRIQGARMPQPPHPQNAPQLGDHVEGGEPLRLVHA